MAIPYYTYLVLKMPGPNGIIIVKGSCKLSDICDKEFHKMAQTSGMTAEYGQPKEEPEQTTPPSTKQPVQDKAIGIKPDIKKLWVHTEDPNKSSTNESGTPIA
jgi:hypothetical protein